MLNHESEKNLSLVWSIHINIYTHTQTWKEKSKRESWEEGPLLGNITVKTSG